MKPLNSLIGRYNGHEWRKATGNVRHTPSYRNIIKISTKNQSRRVDRSRELEKRRHDRILEGDVEK